MQVTANVSVRNGLNDTNQPGCAHLRRRCVVVLNQQLHFMVTPNQQLVQKQIGADTDVIEQETKLQQERSSFAVARKNIWQKAATKNYVPLRYVIMYLQSSAVTHYVPH
jgi:1-aminocyclopropane-1-carboxylate deaminase/D-cysteine desulfhydrase-like pyridoxal-dependent ACC family enzyme